MAAEDDVSDEIRGTHLEDLLEEARSRYVDEHGEEPPDAFMRDAREAILREIAKRGRDDHREVYDALADE